MIHSLLLGGLVKTAIGPVKFQDMVLGNKNDVPKPDGDSKSTAPALDWSFSPITNFINAVQQLPWIADAPDVKSPLEIGGFVNVGDSSALDEYRNSFERNPYPEVYDTYTNEAHRDIFNAFDRNDYRYVHDPYYSPFFSPSFNPERDLPSNRIQWFASNSRPLVGDNTSSRYRQNASNISLSTRGRGAPNPGAYFRTKRKRLPEGVGGQTYWENWWGGREPSIAMPRGWDPSLPGDAASYAHEGGHALSMDLMYTAQSPYDRWDMHRMLPRSDRETEFPSTVVADLYSMYNGYRASNPYTDLLYPPLMRYPGRLVADEMVRPEGQSMSEYNENLLRLPYAVRTLRPQMKSPYGGGVPYIDTYGRYVPEVPVGPKVYKGGLNTLEYMLREPFNGLDGPDSWFNPTHHGSDKDVPENLALIYRNIGGITRAWKDAKENRGKWLAMQEQVQRELDPLYAQYRPSVGRYDARLYDSLTKNHGNRNSDLPVEVMIPFTVKQIIEDAVSGDYQRHKRAMQYAHLLRPDLYYVLRANGIKALHRDFTKYDNLMSILNSGLNELSPEMYDVQREFSITPGFDRITDFRSIDQMVDILNYLRKGRDRQKYYQHVGEDMHNIIG